MRAGFADVCAECMVPLTLPLARVHRKFQGNITFLRVVSALGKTLQRDTTPLQPEMLARRVWELLPAALRGSTAAETGECGPDDMAILKHAKIQFQCVPALSPIACLACFLVASANLCLL